MGVLSISTVRECVLVFISLHENRVGPGKTNAKDQKKEMKENS
jgi:hypothetical protein